MQKGNVVGFVFAAGAVCLLNGCVPNAGVTRPVAVKTIMPDVDGYAAREFTATSLPDQVERTVTNADSQPVGFHRLVVDTITDTTQNGGTGISHYSNQVTYENQGNGLVQAIGTMSSNGIPISESFYVSYRNLYTLRQQRVALSSINAERILQTETISHFDTPSNGHEMHISYEYGYVGQTRNFVPGDVNCVFGRSFNASEISKEISGKARDLDCQVSNRNGAVFDKSHGAYLDQYGIFIVLKRETSTANVKFNVTGFRAE